MRKDELVLGEEYQVKYEGSKWYDMDEIVKYERDDGSVSPLFRRKNGDTVYICVEDLQPLKDSEEDLKAIIRDAEAKLAALQAKKTEISEINELINYIDAYVERRYGEAAKRYLTELIKIKKERK